MNIQLIKDGLTQKFGRTGLQLQKHSPEILLGAGLVGMLATVVMASKATLKANDLIREHGDRMESIDAVRSSEPLETYSLEDYQKDKVIVHVQTGFEFAKLYAPAISVGVLSVGAILASHGVMAKRQVSLAAAYTLLSEGFQQYRKRVTDELGADVDQDFYLGTKDETRTETVIDEDGKKAKVKTKSKGMIGNRTYSVYSRFYDESNPNYRGDRTLNKAFLIAQQNYANDLLIIRGHVFLNEVYERLGFEHTKEGAIVGWVLKSPEEMKEEGRAGHIDFGIFDVANDPAREFVNGTNPTVLLDFNVDGIIFDLI